jgi:hypothetical protein
MTRSTETTSQVASARKRFEHGSPLPIHGKITTSHVKLTIRGLRYGSLKTMLLQNGSHPDHFYGFMGNVCHPLLPNDTDTDGLYYVAGARKSILWYVNISNSFGSANSCIEKALQLSTTSTICASLDHISKITSARMTRMTRMTSSSHSSNSRRSRILASVSSHSRCPY